LDANGQVNRVDEATRQERMVSPDVIQQGGAGRQRTDWRAKIFTVNSNATGNGVYNCYEQDIDADKWNTSNNTDYLDNKNTDAIEVWNIDENKTVYAWGLATYYYKGAITSNGGSEYRSLQVHTSEASNEPGVGGSWASFWTLNLNSHELSSGDLLLAWQIVDDSGTKRWVGTRILSIAHIIDIMKNIFEAC